MVWEGFGENLCVSVCMLNCSGQEGTEFSHLHATVCGVWLLRTYIESSGKASEE